MTLIESIYALLEADAQQSGVTYLGGMLGCSSSAPYGVYFRNPPESLDYDTYSILTYFIVGMSGKKPREILIAVTAWSIDGDKLREILERVYDVLNEQKLTGLDDYALLRLEWNSAGPELYDEERRVYFQQHRFLAKAWKT